MTDTLFPDLRDPRVRFARLVEALAQRIGQSLDASDGMVVLVDDTQALKLVVELATAEDRAFAVLPFLAIPDDIPRAGEIAGRLLQINADRAALAGATICADGGRGQYCLVLQISLDAEPVDFVRAIEELTDLGETVRAAVLDDVAAPPRPEIGLPAFFQRA
ncbi:MAG TPA: CesT family type III secretion system chaperone [Ramlibacter sp.]|nr:CesT family type III secretion system chaperone [Ramlibacter sp.]